MFPYEKSVLSSRIYRQQAPPRILIVGCGIAGPTLASFLLLADIPTAQKPHITILERESTRKAHLRGQNIDIRGAGVTIIPRNSYQQLEKVIAPLPSPA